MTEKEKMLKNMLYIPSKSKELCSEAKNSRRLCRLFNNSTEEEMDKRQEILKELLGSVGKNCYIEPPFRCDYGKNIYIGDNFYANYELIILDCCNIKIGNNVFIAPRVGIYGAGHPIDKDIRNSLLEFGKDITIGDDVWIGANTVINPGVTIGDNVVIGSGSVVTKDIPSNCVAVGNPCKVLRYINENDKKFWEKQKEEYFKNM